MITDLDSYRSYFQDLVDFDDELRGLLFGDMNHIRAEMSYEDDYPLLVLDIPEIAHSGNDDSLQEVWSCSIEVVDQSATDDHDRERDILQCMLVMIRRLRNKIAADMEDADIDMPMKKIILRPVKSILIENMWGWSMSFDLYISTSSC